MIHQFIHKLSYIAGIAICLTLILWSWLEDGFYENYIQGEWFLVWTVYGLPWVVIAMTVTHYFLNRQK